MSNERFARQYRFELPSGFHLTSPCTSIVHHLSGPSMHALARHWPEGQRSACLAPFHGLGQSRFPYAYGFATQILAHMLDSLVRVSRRVGSVRRNGTILGARRLRETRGAPVVGSPRLGARPATAAPLKGCLWRAWWRGPGPSCLPRGARRPPGQSRTDTLASNDFAHFSLSFQSSFHLSLTVLVRYRSPANIQLSMDITTGLALQSQATRLTGGRPEVGRF